MSALSTDTNAKHAILEAAQRLFAADGFESVSLRALTQEAGVNLAAVNYHFKSKEGLIDAVVASYINPVNESRLQRLAAAQADAGEGKSLTLEEVLDCFMRPVLEAVNQSDVSEQLFFKLLGRCMGERGFLRLPQSTLALFGQVTTAFPQALRHGLPHLNEQEILWRLHFTVGVLIHTLIHTESLMIITQGRAGNPTPEDILTKLKSYCIGGLQAPVTNSAP